MMLHALWILLWTPIVHTYVTSSTTTKEASKIETNRRQNCSHLHPSDRKKPPTDDGVSF